jgi:multidrug efflux pump subunit AcrB
LPYGYRIETGGATEESAKANTALAAVSPVMAIAVLVSRLALVFATAPLGLIGATGALLASNRPFGFVALLGLIALADMIMRNTVILVDQIERDIAAGRARYRAIIDATVRRASGGADRACRGSRHDSAGAEHLLGPMAITIMGGLLVATVLTLLVVPALYALWFRVRQDEPDRAAIIPEALAEHDDMEPIPIAAE